MANNFDSVLCSSFSVWLRVWLRASDKAFCRSRNSKPTRRLLKQHKISCSYVRRHVSDKTRLWFDKVTQCKENFTVHQDAWFQCWRSRQCSLQIQSIPTNSRNWIDNFTSLLNLHLRFRIISCGKVHGAGKRMLLSVCLADYVEF